MSYLRKNIEQMEGYSPGFQPKEAGFIKLNTNESPYPPSARIVKAMRAACGESIRKYPPPFAEPFRARAAELFGTKPDCILCGFGSDDILTIAVRALCGEGDLMAFPSPTYSLYGVLAQIQNARAVALDFPEDYSLPPELAGTGARLTLLSNPNAPSGTMIAFEEVRQLADALDGVLLVDEAYVDFAEWNCLELAKTRPNVIVTRTLSKSHGLAGLRFGYAVAHEDLIAGMMKVKDSYNVSAPALAGAVAAISDQEWLRQNVERIRKTRTVLIEGLRRLRCHCWPSQANFVLARLPAGSDAEQVFNELFRRKILVRYFKAPRLDDCLRISVGTDEEIRALLDALREILG